MAINPLDDNDPEYKRLVEERAYHLWQSEGEVHGQHDEYWERARELVNMELAGKFGQKPNPMTEPGADPNRTEPVEDASIQENLGEFPDRFADQGERIPTPKPKTRRRPAPKAE